MPRPIGGAYRFGANWRAGHTFKMVDNIDLHSQILRHLTEAQNGLHLHQKLIKSLTNLLVAEEDASSSSSPRVKQFFKAFLPMLQNCLLVLKREPAAERFIEFVAKFSVSVAMKKPARSEDDSSSDEEEDELDETLCENDFFHVLLYQLMEYLDAKEKSVRFRSCQLISKIFTLAFSNPSQESIRISSSLSDSLADGLLERLKDRFQLVRLYAVSALGYLQDTSDAACMVTAAIIWSMTHDTSPEVRKCAIINVLVTKISLPALIERTRDVKDIVRRAAFLKLSESVSIRNLTIDQRVQLANDGLRDESSKVKEAFTGGLLRNWYIELEDDLLQLLRRLDVENCPDVLELVLLSYFEELEDEDLVESFETSLKRVAEEKEGEREGEEGEKSTNISYVKDCLIPFDDLTCEMVFYWRCLSKYFRSKPEGEGLGFFDRVTPTLSNFCHYFKSYIDSKILKGSSVSDSTLLDNELSVEFVGRQLCGMISCLDFTDEMGRRLLDDLIHQLIINPSYPTSLVSCILKEQVQIWPQEAYRIERLLDMISEIRYPGTTDSATANSVITTSQFMNMSTINLKDDPGSLIKCLAVAGELFRDLKITKLTPPLMTLVESLLLPCIQNENPYVRDMSVFSLGLACLLDVSLARRHILLFIQVIQVDHENVQATSLKVVFDMLHLFGLEAFNLELKPTGEEEEEMEGKEDETVKDGEEQQGEKGEGQGEGSSITEGLAPDNESTTSGQKFLQILTSYLNGKSTLLREVSAEGVSKLLLSGRVVSTPLLVKLLLIWYDPSLHDEDIRTTLGHFFPAYAATDRSYRTSIAEAYIPVMQAVCDAPPTSSLTEVDVTNMSGFIISLSAPHEPTEDSSHDDLSIRILNHLLSDKANDDDDDYDDDGVVYIEWCRLHCQTLTLLKLSPHNTCNNRDIVILVDQLMNSVDDRKCLNSLKKFRNMVDKLLPVTAKVIPEFDKENASSEVGVASAAATPTTRSQSRRVMSQSQLSTRRRGRGRHGDDDDDDEDFSISRTVKKSLKKSNRRKSAKASAKETDGRKKGKRKTIENESDVEESDDSLLGEHSPFVRSRARPKASDPVPSMTSDS